LFKTLGKRLKGDEKGFAVIELVVVIIILGILAAIAIPSYMNFKSRASNTAAQANIRAIIPAIESYYSDNNTYVGMTLSGAGSLQAVYVHALDPSKYTLGAVRNMTATSYCIQSPASGSGTYKKAGPAAAIAAGTCP
jgi:prepilin-type N-terminal cleavage/methylation domain-containing protein